MTGTTGINGETAVYGLLGNPVAKSLSPAIHNALAEITGINSVYATFPVSCTESLKKAVEGAYALGIKGLNVTVPYKRDVMTELCGLSENAGQIGAVNTLKHTENGYMGYNTDITGVIKTLDKHGVSLLGKSVLLLGAGGAAYACGFAAIKCGAGRIYIANRTNNNSELLARQLKKYYNDIDIKVISYDDISHIDSGYFILQTTSVGMDGFASPIGDLGHIENSSGVFDIIYAPLKTKILRDAEKLRKISINGLDMLVFQAIEAFEIWNGFERGDANKFSGRIVSLVNTKLEGK